MNIIQFNKDIKIATEMARGTNKAYSVGQGDELRIVSFVDGTLTIETEYMRRNRIRCRTY